MADLGKAEMLITKTTEVEVQEYNKDNDALSRRGW